MVRKTKKTEKLNVPASTFSSLCTLYVEHCLHSVVFANELPFWCIKQKESLFSPINLIYLYNILHCLSTMSIKQRVVQNLQFTQHHKLILLVFVLILLSFRFSSLFGSEPESSPSYRNVQEKYEDLLMKNPVRLPSLEVFSLALKGFHNLKEERGVLNKNFLTIIDFSLSSNVKRLWVINVNNNQVLFHDLVAHGMNSGNEFATKFSNIPQTNMSSLGFFVTGSTYYGKHGLSLYLNGMDKGFNHNAKKRAIVMHGAKYVSFDFIKKYGRLGRSFGCPSVSLDVYQDVIQTIAEGSCLFIYYPDQEFLSRSVLLKQ